MLNHLSDLRKRLLVALGAIGGFSALIYVYKEWVLQLLLQPLLDLPHAPQVMTTGIAELFFVYFKLAGYGGLFMAFPVLFYLVWNFVSPGLYEREKRIVIPALIAIPCLFYCGALFAYFVVLPLALQFFFGFEQVGVVQMPHLADYLSFFMMSAFAFGAAFNLPVVLVLLVAAGFLSVSQLIAARRWMIVAIFVVAAALTPPDPISQSFLAVPLVILYECAIFLAKRVRGL